MTVPADAAIRQAYDHCAALVRQRDKDRFLAALYAPEGRRGALLALYAFDLEVAHVRALARQPLPGELRLQWWREALAGERAGEARANPVAAALLDALAGAGAPRAPLIGLIDARAFDLYDEPMRTLEQLQDHVRRTAGAVMATAAAVLQPAGTARGEEAVGHAGMAFGLCDLLRAFPLHAARGQLYLPLEVLQRHGVAAEQIHMVQARPGLLAALAELRELARDHQRQAESLIAAVPPAVLPALLPMAAVPLYLAAMGLPGYDPLKSAVEVAPWRRQWALWRTAMRWSYRQR